MKKTNISPLEQVVSDARKRRACYCAITLLCVVAVLFTVNLLKHRANTLERIEACGLEAHLHSEACYDEEGALICALEEHVHTDACYQTAPVQDVELDLSEVLVDDDSGEAPPLELDDFMLGEADDGIVAESPDPEPVPEAELPDPEPVAPDYRYTVGNQCPVYLDDILAAVGLAIDGPVEVGQVVDEGHPEGMIRVERDGEGWAIYPTQSFDRLELALFTEDDCIVVDLLDAAAPEAAPAQETTPETEETPISEATVEPEGAAEGEAFASDTFDLAVDIAGSAGPFSLKGWMARAAADAADEGAPEGEAPDAAAATEDWSLDFDGELLSVQFADDDYWVAPLGSFEETAVSVNTGAALYRIALMNRQEALPHPGNLSGTVEAKVDGADYALRITVPEAANLPPTATFEAVAVEDDFYRTAALEAVPGEGDYRLLAVFDLTIYDGGQAIQPDAALDIHVDFGEALPENMRVAAVHFTEREAQAAFSGKKKLAAKGVARKTEVIEATGSGDGVTFQASSFSVYAVVGTVIEKNVLASDGRNYHITVTCGADSGIPGDAELVATEIPVESDLYGKYVSKTESALGMEEGGAGYIRLFDISIVGKDGEKLQPAAGSAVDVRIELADAADVRDLSVVHFASADAQGDVVNADIAGQAVEFEASGFSVYAVAGAIVQDYLSDSGVLYEVKVTYGPEANLPEGARLKITEFSEGSEDYDYARRAVLADMAAKGEPVNLSTFGLAALDISILDANGIEIEPEAPVQVDIRIKGLPGVDDLSEIADTLAIQHHVKVEGGVVVETVYDGSAEASFKLETDETVAAQGIVVDPYSVREEDFASFDPAVEDFVESGSDHQAGEGYVVSFQTPVFSTFTVTWGTPASADNRQALDGNSFVLVNENNSAALIAENINNNTRLKAVSYSQSDDSITKWHFQRVNNYSWYYYITDGNGHYLNIGNGNNSHVRVSNTPQQIYVDRNSNGLLRLQRSDNSNSTAVNLYGGNINSGFGPYNDRGSNEWFRAYYPTAGNMATIHYVDESGNELSVANGQPVNDTTPMTYYSWDSWYGRWNTIEYPYNYLIYDVEGYEYAYTYRNTDDDRITPILTYRDNSWKYTSGKNTTGASNTWNDLSANDDIYVVYKHKEKVPQGGTPKPKITGEKPETPTITKGSTVNGDGTNTLSLSVTGHTSVMEAEKLADVIVVFDISGSMNEDMAGHDPDTEGYSGKSRFVNAKDATTTLANSLLGKNTTEHPDLIRMSLISFSNTAQKELDFTTSKTDFISAVNTLPTPDGGTNWEYALQMANEMAVESDRATFVIFVTDGNPTFRQTRGVLNNGGTGSLGDNDVSDYYFGYNVYGVGSSDEHGRNYAAALVQAKSIVSSGKNFYTIGISNDVTNLTNLTTQSEAGADHSKTATSNDELVAAFNDIAASIIAHLGHSDVKITDGITNLTQTVRKSDLVSFAEDDFTYYKGHAATAEDVASGLATAVGETVWVSWDPDSEGCARAVYNASTGAVEWNMGEGFMLEEGYTYQVRFKVWPSQEAYDLLADLNNGKKDYASLTDAEKAQIKEPTTAGGMYTLKTNSETSYTYREATKSGDTVTPIGEPSEPGSFPDVDPLELTTKPLKVKKQWHRNYVDSRALVDHITMELYGVDSDGDTPLSFKTFTLSEAGGWYAENNYISYGLVTYDPATNAGAKVYETGHDFTLREIDDEAHYYELTAGVFRPMFINGTPTILEQVDAAPAGMGDDVFHYSDGSRHYYRLDGKIYRDTQSDTLLLATNTHRSYMDLKKVVVDEYGVEAADDREFEYSITFKVPEGIANYETTEKYIWFSVYDSAAHRTLSPSEYTYTNAQKPADADSAYSGTEYADYLVATSGSAFTLKLKPGWNARFLNLPIGTTYSFEEINIPTGYDFVKAQVSGTQWIANMVDGQDQGAAQGISSLPSNTSGSNSDTGISGTIDLANARYSTTYTNTYNDEITGSLTVTKALAGKSPDAAPTGTYAYPIRVTTTIEGTTWYVAWNSAENRYELTTTETELTVENGTPLTITGLPLVNRTYKVEEVNPGSVEVSGYTNVQVEGTTVESVDSIRVTPSTPGEANLVNVYERDKGSLYIDKTVTVNGSPLANTTLVDGTYAFTVQSDAGVSPATTKNVTITLTGGVITAVGGDAALEDGKAKVTGLPTGAYTVTENLSAAQQAKGITFTASGNTGVSVTKDNDAGIPTAAFVNNIDVGSLKITKQAKVGTADAASLSSEVNRQLVDGTYTFNVYTDATATTPASKADGTPVGDVTVEILNGAAVAAAEVADLLPGTYYVKETAGTNAAVPLDGAIYSVTVEGGKVGQAVESAGTATAANTRPAGSLKVTKAIRSTSGETMAQTPSYPITVAVVLDGATCYVQDASGALGTQAPEPPLMVTAGTDLTIDNLPYGSYTVAEVNPGSVEIDDYSYVVVDGSKPSGTATVDEAQGEADLVNFYTKGTSWTPDVNKLLNGEPYTGADFSFTITRTQGGDYTETVGTVTGGAIAFQPIPYTVYDAGKTYIYAITEQKGEDPNVAYDAATIYAKVTVTNDNGTLVVSEDYFADADCTQPLNQPAFANTDLGALTVAKTVSGSYTATDGDVYPFTIKQGDSYVTASADQGDATKYAYTGLSETEVVYSVKAGEANKLTFVNLPVGTYVVAEGDVSKPGYVITTTYTVDGTGASPAAANVAKGETRAVVIDNHYRDAELTITKVIEGVEADDLDAVAANIAITVADGEGTAILNNVPLTDALFTGSDNTYTATLTSADYTAIVPDGAYTVTETMTGVDGYELRSSTWQVTAGATTGAEAQEGTEGRVTLSGADTSVGAMAFTNTYMKLVDVDVTKTWGDGQQPPEGATITAKLTGSADDAAIGDDELKALTGLEDLEITLNGGEAPTAWHHQWTGLPKYDGDGHQITYGVAERTYTIGEDTVDLASFIPEVSPGEGTNQLILTNRIPTTQIKAKKNWPGGQTVPDGTAIELTITAKVGDDAPNGVTITPVMVTLDGQTDDIETTPWEYGWKDLPQYDRDGRKIAYTVEETGYRIGDVDYAALIPGADETASAGYDFSFTNALPTTQVTVKKTWSGGTDWLDGNIKVEMTLKADGEAPASLPAHITTAHNGETGEDLEASVPQTAAVWLTSADAEAGKTWYELPMYALDGHLIAYTVEETGMKYGGTPLGNYRDVFTVSGGNTSTAGVVTIDNAPKETELEVTKAWTLNGAPRTDKTAITFQVYQKLGDGEGTLLDDVLVSVGEADPAPNGSPTVTVACANGTWQVAKISGLPRYVLVESDGAASYVEASYYVVETGAGEDTHVTYLAAQQDGEGAETADPPAASTTGGRVTIINRDYSVDIRVEKIDETTRSAQAPTKLNGARFRLYKYMTPETGGPKSYLRYPDEQSYEFETRNDGTLTIRGLPDGEYRLEESKTPDGYIKTVANDIYFRLENGVAIRYTASAETDGRAVIAEGEDAGGLMVTYRKAGDAPATFTVGNKPGAQLPSTGGPGTGALYAIGAALMALAAIWLARDLKKRYYRNDA